ncbi:MAG: delta-60 repeat domain-containing protein, partial [Deltaproteobacteria bacterium]|nr:delta-60 repeat domain-containing protein [Deltaproteobacteria bacterium]
LAAIGTDVNGNATIQGWDPNPNGEISALAVSGSTVYVAGDFTTIGGGSRNRLAAIGTDGTLQSWDPSPNGYVYTFAVSGSTVYAGGSFTSIGGQTQWNRLAKFDYGVLDTNWNPSASSYWGGHVHTLTVIGSTVFAGGSFETIGGIPYRNFAPINATTGLLE